MQQTNHSNSSQAASGDVIPRVAITPKEFGASFGKSLTWAYRRIYAGEVRVLPGHPRLIPVSEIERFLSRAKPQK